VRLRNWDTSGVPASEIRIQTRSQVAKRETAERIDGRATVEASTPSDQIAAVGALGATFRPASTPARCAVLTVSLLWPAADGRR
jgi:hypothetical protein